MRPGLVGTRIALEVVESWYKSIHRVETSMWERLSMNETGNIIRVDTFFVGLDPTAILRELVPETSIESLTNHKREKSAYAI
jgi:hypothetical protein